MKTHRGAKQRAAVILIIIAALVVVGAVSAVTVYSLYRSGNAAVAALADRVKVLICDVRLPKAPDGYAGLEEYELEEYSGASAARGTDAVVLKNSAKGYMLPLPADTVFDFSLAPLYVSAENELFELKISREYSTEADAAAYTEHYFDRFMLSETWRSENGAELLSDERHGNVRSFTVHLADLGSECPDTYTYVNIFTETQIFYRLVFKYFHADIDEVSAYVENAVSQFEYFKPHGKCDYSVSYGPDTSSLSDEALAVYEDIVQSDSVSFGIFTGDITGKGINEKIPNLEAELEYEFPVILAYRHLSEDFPTEFMEKCYDDGRIVELTYQITVSNNIDLEGFSPQLDIYRGGYDEKIRAFARAAAEFGHPFLLRLSNEMNSDWTSWSGVVNMCDPDIYREVWRRIFAIFAEEGADNAIWIWNPNDRSYPPADWNEPAAYYPGDGYVHLVGITGYNTGNYYSDIGERWRSFKDIYKRLEDETAPLFGDFPWIITEFSSASAGGDKAKWIDGMFNSIGDFPNIKIAVWFDSVDLDPAYPGENVIGRDYRIDDTEETVEAMKKGLSKLG